MDKFRNKRILSLTAAAALAMGCLLLFGSLAWNLEKRDHASWIYVRPGAGAGRRIPG